METSRNLHLPLGGRRPQGHWGLLFGWLYSCHCLLVWEKLRPSRGRRGTAQPWLFVP
jgi:hypothetical protein